MGVVEILPVGFGPHRLRLRPREGPGVRLNSFRLDLRPPADLAWTEDVYGNALATASFSGTADELVVASSAQVELEAAPWPVFPIAAEAISFPFAYAPEDRRALGALLDPVYAAEAGPLAAWTGAVASAPPKDTLLLLAELNDMVGSKLVYEARESEGTQTPLETLHLGRGSCRDLAVLFADAVRGLGLGVRLVSGYLYDPDRALLGSANEGSTHAWAEVFVPGAGWIAYDPTNRRVGGFSLVPTAIARVIERASPVEGSYIGPPDALIAMTVEVAVT
jgi:transglutaminase-like putative cysteine protease